MEVIRDDARTHPPATRRLAELYRAGAAGLDRRPIVPFSATAPGDVIAWEAAGTQRVGSAIVDGYRLRHDGLVLPLVHVHGPGAPRRGLVVLLDLAGKIGPRDWPTVEARLAEGREVLSLDPRGLGETRMHYRAASIDDPSLAPPDEEAAYADPLSGVLANHAYNAQLLGRPYLFEMIDDVGLAVRFARERLGAHEIVVEGRGDARLLARAAAASLPGVALAASPGEAGFSWKDAVEHLQEVWPIHYLVPGGVALSVDEPEGATR
jgi:hypothetical protein